MDRALRNIAFVVEDLAPDTPPQHLLDRFLRGYPRDGEFHRVEDCQIHIWLPAGAADAQVQRRVKDFGLRRHDSMESALGRADGIIFVPRQISNPQLLASTIRSASADSAVFVHGALADSYDQAHSLVALAASRNVVLCAGTSTSTTWRLPDVEVPAGARITDALIIVQGDSPLAELHALDGLLPLLERRNGGERGIRQVHALQVSGLWADTGIPTTQIQLTATTGSASVLPRRRGESASVSRALSAAALSRSDTPQGDPVRDGRTQDLLGLGLVPKLAKNPRGFVLDHIDGPRTTVLVLDGVIADFNFAVQLADGSIVSAQLHRPPPPQRHEYSRLAEVIEDYFRSHKSPSPLSRALLTSGLLQAFARVRSAPGHVATPQLDVSQFLP